MKDLNEAQKKLETLVDKEIEKIKNNSEELAKGCPETFTNYIGTDLNVFDYFDEENTNGVAYAFDPSCVIDYIEAEQKFVDLFLNYDTKGSFSTKAYCSSLDLNLKINKINYYEQILNWYNSLTLLPRNNYLTQNLFTTTNLRLWKDNNDPYLLSQYNFRTDDAIYIEMLSRSKDKLDKQILSFTEFI